MKHFIVILLPIISIPLGAMQIEMQSAGIKIPSDPLATAQKIITDAKANTAGNEENRMKALIFAFNRMKKNSQTTDVEKAQPKSISDTNFIAAWMKYCETKKAIHKAKKAAVEAPAEAPAEAVEPAQVTTLASWATNLINAAMEIVADSNLSPSTKQKLMNWGKLISYGATGALAITGFVLYIYQVVHNKCPDCPICPTSGS